MYEAKLVLLGEERAGKSTLAEALYAEDFEIDPNKESTKGIDILEWTIAKEKTNTPKDFRFNIWDFGGQDIYHSTHQFFLKYLWVFTRRSLYLFVTEARKDLRFDDFYYWLNIIKSLSSDSPILIVQNKADQHAQSTSISGYKEIFSSICGDLQKISCNTQDACWQTQYKAQLGILKERIFELVRSKKIAGIGDPLPKKWVSIHSHH